MHWFGVISVAVLLAGSLQASGESDAIDEGRAVYMQTCVACHGGNGKGAIPGVPDLTVDSGVLSKSNSELLHNIVDGFQSPGAMLAMPPKGGNPALSEKDVQAVIAYMRAEFAS